jgi:hypothetical protein
MPALPLAGVAYARDILLCHFHFRHMQLGLDHVSLPINVGPKPAPYSSMPPPDGIDPAAGRGAGSVHLAGDLPSFLSSFLSFLYWGNCIRIQQVIHHVHYHSITCFQPWPGHTKYCPSCANSYNLNLVSTCGLVRLGMDDLQRALREQNNSKY